MRSSLCAATSPRQSCHSRGERFFCRNRSFRVRSRTKTHVSPTVRTSRASPPHFSNPFPTPFPCTAGAALPLCEGAYLNCRLALLLESFRPCAAAASPRAPANTNYGVKTPKTPLLAHVLQESPCPSSEPRAPPPSLLPRRPASLSVRGHVFRGRGKAGRGPTTYVLKIQAGRALHGPTPCGNLRAYCLLLGRPAVIHWPRRYLPKLQFLLGSDRFRTGSDRCR